ncbi:unnamed protein product [Rodentolepis nana]|uniref:Tr-type G domain-containing protein n=1 Tax=Rodentolepis nana TaxID=102285 RepID=A0A0R3TC86_RODNA|nr:unnamed protein product [Rodentolepis nana]
MNYDKSNINLVILGHIGSGKSALICHLISKYGTLDKNYMTKFENELLSIEPSSSKYAWVLKKLKTERESCDSTDSSFWQFRSPRHTVTVIDAPGHDYFIRNMITGSSHADCAILIDSAAREEFKASMSQEYADLAYTLGIMHLIIVVNKVDTINYDEKRFRDYSNEMRLLVGKVGYNPDNVKVIPVSGLNGDNILKLSPHTPWYKGPTLLQSIDITSPLINPVDKPLRFSIENVRLLEDMRIISFGKLESGIMKTGMDVSFAPSGITSKVLVIKKANDSIAEAEFGDKIGFLVKEISVGDIANDNIVGDLNNNPPRPAIDFTALICILDFPGEISAGFTSPLDCHNIRVPGKFIELLEKIDPQTGQVIERNPPKIKSGDAAIVKIVPRKPVCLEVFSQYPSLGRFSIPNGDSKAIFGVIKSITFKEKKSMTSLSQRIKKRFSSR